jgi:hypothetical protein
MYLSRNKGVYLSVLSVEDIVLILMQNHRKQPPEHYPAIATTGKFVFLYGCVNDILLHFVL